MSLTDRARQAYRGELVARQAEQLAATKLLASQLIQRLARDFGFIVDLELVMPVALCWKPGPTVELRHQGLRFRLAGTTLRVAAPCPRCGRLGRERLVASLAELGALLEMPCGRCTAPDSYGVVATLATSAAMTYPITLLLLSGFFVDGRLTGAVCWPLVSLVPVVWLAYALGGWPAWLGPAVSHSTPPLAQLLSWWPLLAVGSFVAGAAPQWLVTSAPVLSLPLSVFGVVVMAAIDPVGGVVALPDLSADLTAQPWRRPPPKSTSPSDSVMVHHPGQRARRSALATASKIMGSTHAA